MWQEKAAALLVIEEDASPLYVCAPQDADTLLGRQPLSAVLARRGGLISTPAFKPPQPVPAPAPSAPPAAADTSSAAPAAQQEAAPAFAVERGFIEAALVCLAASSEARRRSFAQQLVQQLQRLADAVGRLPLPLVSEDSGAAQVPPLEGSIGSPAAGGTPTLDRTFSGPQQATSPLAAGRLGSGWGSGGWGGRAGGGGWGGGARGGPRGKPASDAVGPVAGVQVGVWLRLGVLFPMLPLVYTDTSPDPASTLRALLLTAATRSVGGLLASLASPCLPAAAHASPFAHDDLMCSCWSWCAAGSLPPPPPKKISNGRPA